MPINNEAKQNYRLIKFLKVLGFSNVATGQGFSLGGQGADVVAAHETTLLIFKCATEGENLAPKNGQISQ